MGSVGTPVNIVKPTNTSSSISGTVSGSRGACVAVPPFSHRNNVVNNVGNNTDSSTLPAYMSNIVRPPAIPPMTGVDRSRPTGYAAAMQHQLGVPPHQRPSQQQPLGGGDPRRPSASPHVQENMRCQE